MALLECIKRAPSHRYNFYGRIIKRGKWERWQLFERLTSTSGLNNAESSRATIIRDVDPFSVEQVSHSSGNRFYDTYPRWFAKSSHLIEKGFKYLRPYRVKPISFFQHFEKNITVIQNNNKHKEIIREKVSNCKSNKYF